MHIEIETSPFISMSLKRGGAFEAMIPEFDGYILGGVGDLSLIVILVMTSLIFFCVNHYLIFLCNRGRMRKLLQNPHAHSELNLQLDLSLSQ